MLVKKMMVAGICAVGFDAAVHYTNTSLPLEFSRDETSIDPDCVRHVQTMAMIHNISAEQIGEPIQPLQSLKTTLQDIATECTLTKSWTPRIAFP